MRAAALIADGSMDRIEARERVEEALELERELMNGRSLTNAIELAAWTEEGVRRLLRQAALGELGRDLIGAADETLIATGLAEGDAEITVSVAAPAEDQEPEVAEIAELESRLEPNEPSPEDVYDYERPPLDPPAFDAPIEVSEASSELELPNFEVSEENEEEQMPEQETRILEPVPAEHEIKITATPWLDEVSDSRRGDSLEWPAPPEDSDRDIQHRERIDTPRVRHLFPVPDSDWDVPHLEFDYDRKR
jgi:hypothetical protein